MAYDSSKPANNSTLTSSEIRENFRALKEDGIVAVASKGVVQKVSSQIQTHANGTTTIPVDYSYPQNTEGTEIMTLAITPTNSSNTLIIEVYAFVHSNASSDWFTIALFQDSTANALCSETDYVWGGGSVIQLSNKLTYTMTAGTTSATTFKIRLGSHSGGAWYLNSVSSGEDVFGGAIASSITITEVKA